MKVSLEEQRDIMDKIKRENIKMQMLTPYIKKGGHLQNLSSIQSPHTFTSSPIDLMKSKNAKSPIQFCHTC